jgi:hypothetical protein
MDAYGEADGDQGGLGAAYLIPHPCRSKCHTDCHDFV